MSSSVEYSMIYRHIASQGVGIARQFVAHPIARQFARRDVAVSFVHEVDEPTQETIEDVQNPRTHLDEIFVDLDERGSNDSSSVIGENNADVNNTSSNNREDPTRADCGLGITFHHSSQSPIQEVTEQQIEQTSSRVPFGGFLTRSGSRIRSPDHESALIGILQVAAGHSDGIAGALGHNNCADWVRCNIDAIFQEDGPMGRFIPLSAQVFQHHLGAAQRLAQSMDTSEHSNDPSGARHEDVPVWVQYIFGSLLLWKIKTHPADMLLKHELNEPLL
ncbi:hypothetical protein HJC23_005306 [Cyclotella cryptica]|uniref:Uncharacterized protein n=1 Tax=Cyclotella cryptica TaxID=29204 RepID=A0ABD3PFA6_9STRA